MKEFNFNAKVYVKLTDFGINILRQNHDNLISQGMEPIEFEIKIDENGYTKFTFAELMMTFGQYLSYSRPTPFEADVRISEEELNDVETKTL